MPDPIFGSDPLEGYGTSNNQGVWLQFNARNPDEPIMRPNGDMNPNAFMHPSDGGTGWKIHISAKTPEAIRALADLGAKYQIPAFKLAMTEERLDRFQNPDNGQAGKAAVFYYAEKGVDGKTIDWQAFMQEAQNVLDRNGGAGAAVQRDKALPGGDGIYYRHGEDAEGNYRPRAGITEYMRGRGIDSEMSFNLGGRDDPFEDISVKSGAANVPGYDKIPKDWTTEKSKTRGEEFIRRTVGSEDEAQDLINELKDNGIEARMRNKGERLFVEIKPESEDAFRELQSRQAASSETAVSPKRPSLPEASKDEFAAYLERKAAEKAAREAGAIPAETVTDSLKPVSKEEALAYMNRKIAERDAERTAEASPAMAADAPEAPAKPTAAITDDDIGKPRYGAKGLEWNKPQYAPYLQAKRDQVAALQANDKDAYNAARERASAAEADLADARIAKLDKLSVDGVENYRLDPDRAEAGFNAEMERLQAQSAARAARTPQAGMANEPSTEKATQKTQAPAGYEMRDNGGAFNMFVSDEYKAAVEAKIPYKPVIDTDNKLVVSANTPESMAELQKLGADAKVPIFRTEEGKATFYFSDKAADGKDINWQEFAQKAQAIAEKSGMGKDSAVKYIIEGSENPFTAVSSSKPDMSKQEFDRMRAEIIEQKEAEKAGRTPIDPNTLDEKTYNRIMKAPDTENVPLDDKWTTGTDGEIRRPMMSLGSANRTIDSLKAAGISASLTQENKAIYIEVPASDAGKFRDMQELQQQREQIYDWQEIQEKAGKPLKRENKLGMPAFDKDGKIVWEDATYQPLQDAQRNLAKINANARMMGIKPDDTSNSEIESLRQPARDKIAAAEQDLAAERLEKLRVMNPAKIAGYDPDAAGNMINAYKEQITKLQTQAGITPDVPKPVMDAARATTAPTASQEAPAVPATTPASSMATEQNTAATPPAVDTPDAKAATPDTPSTPRSNGRANAATGVTGGTIGLAMGAYALNQSIQQGDGTGIAVASTNLGTGAAQSAVEVAESVGKNVGRGLKSVIGKANVAATIIDGAYQIANEQEGYKGQRTAAVAATTVASIGAGAAGTALAGTLAAGATATVATIAAPITLAVGAAIGVGYLGDTIIETNKLNEQIDKSFQVTERYRNATGAWLDDSIMERMDKMGGQRTLVAGGGYSEKGEYYDLVDPANVQKLKQAINEEKTKYKDKMDANETSVPRLLMFTDAQRKAYSNYGEAEWNLRRVDSAGKELDAYLVTNVAKDFNEKNRPALIAALEENKQFLRPGVKPEDLVPMLNTGDAIQAMQLPKDATPEQIAEKLEKYAPIARENEKKLEALKSELALINERKAVAAQEMQVAASDPLSEKLAAFKKTDEYTFAQFKIENLEKGIAATRAAEQKLGKNVDIDENSEKTLLETKADILRKQEEYLATGTITRNNFSPAILEPLKPKPANGMDEANLAMAPRQDEKKSSSPMLSEGNTIIAQPKEDEPSKRPEDLAAALEKGGFFTNMSKMVSDAVNVSNTNSGQLVAGTASDGTMRQSNLGTPS